MRAWRLTTRGLELVEAPTPEPGAGHAIVRPVLIGIGASDVRTAHAGGFEGTLGHEFVGVIEHVESSDSQGLFKVGQRVTAWPTLPCETCDLCKGGLANHCRQLRTLGQRGADGCLAERMSVPLNRLIALPDSMDDEVALFTQPLGTAIHAARLIALEAQAFVTVLGDGVLGLMAAQVMSRRNATVRLLTEQQAALEVCAKLGLRHRETNLTGLRADQDAVVECSGQADASALGMVRPRGSIIQACPPARALDLADAWASEIQLLCARGCAMIEAVHALTDGSIRTEGMLDRTLSFDQAGDALALAARPGALKVAVRGGG